MSIEILIWMAHAAVAIVSVIFAWGYGYGRLQLKAHLFAQTLLQLEARISQLEHSAEGQSPHRNKEIRLQFDRLQEAIRRQS